MRVLFNIAFLAFFIIQIELNLSTFQRQIFREEKWPQTVYKELSFKVDSKLECAALCEVESKSCVGIIWIDSVCYLTDPMSQFSEISSPQTKDQSMYINQEIISSILSVFLHLIDPIVNHWMARVYASIPTTSMFDCNVECATDFNCQLYVKEGSLCHLGNGTFFNSSIQIKEIPTEGVYVDTGFTIEAGPMVFLNDSSSTWMHHIYYSSICDLRERCELWCFLERSPCQFMVYTGSICYLGSTEQESQMVNNSSMAPTQKVWLTKKGIENTNYEIAFERNIYSTNYAPFIIKSYNADDFLQSCDFFCAFQTEPACHFFFLTGGICYLGNMDGTHPSIENSASLETIHIHLPVSNASLLEFYSIPMHHHTWRIRMHTQIITNSTIGACALRCLIMDLQKECSLFVYDESICYLGATSHYEYAQTIDDIFNVYIAKSLALYLQRYFKSRLTSDWASQMYKKVVLYYPTPQNADECLLRCHFDDGPCHSFVVHENECYLGDPFVNSSLFFGTENALIMEKNTQLYLSHGGSKGDGDEKTSSIFEGCNGQCNHSLLDLPYPLRAMGYAYGEDSIFVCGGTSDVNGGEQDKCYQWRFKVFPRAWIPLPAMMNNQMMFPMLYHQGKLYAAGGRSSGSTIGNMRFLDLNSTSWTNGGAYEYTGFYAHCGILYQDRIYTFGGSRNSLLFSSAVQGYDIWPVVLYQEMEAWFLTYFLLRAEKVIWASIPIRCTPSIQTQM
ncbi:hypothetical protein TCAL_08073 [Tigriopus californicus]|uniref:Apple domain-containing protein n=1 Tax=Tigriopus californicus TaxID=6832 RepID=A0A553NSA1_TIGCA|nr:hypothetical protein TCAL_08073 [Tigriopus californicus]